jgi:ankyrin repeat protein
VCALLAAGAGINAENNNGWTALAYASAADCVEVVRALLAAGAGVDAADNDGYTALHR